MSLYNLVAGFNPNAGIALKMLHIDPQNIPRFRDAWFSDDGKTITILTRTGGGNRPDYEKENAELRLVGQFIDDRDDSFDSTFAHFHYKTPEEYVADVKAITDVMLAAGKGAANQGPEAMVRSLSMPIKPLKEFTADSPEIHQAGLAFDRIIERLQQEEDHVS